MFNKVMGC